MLKSISATKTWYPQWPRAGSCSTAARTFGRRIWDWNMVQGKALNQQQTPNTTTNYYLLLLFVLLYFTTTTATTSSQPRSLCNGETGSSASEHISQPITFSQVPHLGDWLQSQSTSATEVKEWSRCDFTDPSLNRLARCCEYGAHTVPQTATSPSVRQPSTQLGWRMHGVPALCSARSV